MSVSLNPSSTLGFRRPLTTLVKRSLTITNNNTQPVAFKVKTTAPKLYCVRPNFGRVEPGESFDVSIMLEPLREEPPLNTKCKDKFLIQSTIITPDNENLTLRDIWASPKTSEEDRVFLQKLTVTYLPAEDQTIEEITAKYNVAQEEIKRLKAQIALLTAQQEPTRRTRKVSDGLRRQGSGLKRSARPLLDHGLASCQRRAHGVWRWLAFRFKYGSESLETLRNDK